MPRGREVVFPIAEVARLRKRAPFLAVNGHYHRRQKFVDPKTKLEIQVPGSAARLTFSEEKNEPGFLIARV